MAALYEDPARADSFPQVRDMLAGLPAGEVELVEAVIARHELGRVPFSQPSARNGGMTSPTFSGGVAMPEVLGALRFTGRLAPAAAERDRQGERRARGGAPLEDGPQL